MKVSHKKSNQLEQQTGAPKAPSASDIDYGEIAINYHEGSEKIFVKNDNDKIASFATEEQIDTKLSTKISGDGVTGIVKLFQSEYDALPVKLDSVFYIVKPDIISAGTIAYWNGSMLKYCHPENWVSTLGTPVAIVVVPSGHTPDGTVRCIAVTGVNSDGSQATSNITQMAWAQYSTNTPLPNLNQVPRWDNTIGGTIGSDSYALLSSNNNNGQFTGATDCLDSNLHYVDTSQYLPNPYLPDGLPNPDFRNTSIVTNNACADFNGASNTSVLVGLGTAYTAANACHKYSADGISAGNWYLPACGELAYIIPRFNEIQNALSAVGGVRLRAYDDYWSSSESDSGYAYNVSTNRGMVCGRSKTYALYVRCFCSLPANLGF